MLEKLQYPHIEIIGGGSVYPINSGKQTMGLAFYYRIGEGEKKRKVVTGCSENELREKVVAFLDKMEKEYISAEEIAKAQLEALSKPKTFREVADLWYEKYSARLNSEKDSLSYSTVSCRKDNLKKINKMIGDRLIGEITQSVAEELIDYYSVKPNGEYYSESFVSKLHDTFQMVMEYALKNGYCNQGIEKISLSEKLTKVKTDERFLDRDQIALLLNVVNKNPRYKMFLTLLINTGLRQEEALALHIDDFKVKKNNVVEVTINKTDVEVGSHEYKIVHKTKTKGSTRTIIISYEIYEMLMQYYQNCIENETPEDSAMRSLNGMDGYIFLNKDMKPINKRTLETNFKKYLKRNGAPECSFKATLHMFRHSYASFCAEKLKVEVVAKILGDSPETVYKNYYSLSDNAKKEIANNSLDIYKSICDSDESGLNEI